MADFQVTCIVKPDRDNRHEAISKLGGPEGLWTRQEMVRDIKNKTHSFYTLVNGKRAEIGVYKEEYVRTYADSTWTDNLLALAECAWPKVA